MRWRFLLGFWVGQLALFGFAAMAMADNIHVVLPGDTLSALARRFGVGVDRLVADNGLPSPDFIYVGQRLNVPEPEAGGASPSAGDGNAVTGAGGAGGTHLVAPGETLGQIADRYGSTVAALVRANNLASPNLIWAGIRLVVPMGDVVAGDAVSAATDPAQVDAGARTIIIDLSDSRLYAYEGDALVQAFAISTGGPGTATPVGHYSIRRRLPRQDMSGPGYYAPDVPWVQYFYGEYAIHGTYWHNSFGEAVSHGCVNMRTPEAQWLYFWSEQGTPVEVRW